MSEAEELIKSHVSNYTKTSMNVELLEDITPEIRNQVFQENCFLKPQKIGAKRDFIVKTQNAESVIPLSVFKILFNVEVSQEFLDTIVEIPAEKPKVEQKQPAPQQRPKPQPPRDNYNFSQQRNENPQQNRREGNYSRNYQDSNDNYEDENAYEAPSAPAPPPPPNKRRDEPLFTIPGRQQPQQQQQYHDDYQRPKRHDHGYKSQFYDNGGDEDDYDNAPRGGFGGRQQYEGYQRRNQQYNRRYNESSRFYDAGDDDDNYNERPPPPPQQQQPRSNYSNQDQPRRDNYRNTRQNAKHETHLTLDDFPTLESMSAPAAKPAAPKAQQKETNDVQPQNEPEQNDHVQEESAQQQQPINSVWANVTNEDDKQEEIPPNEDEFWKSKKNDPKVYAKIEDNVFTLGGNAYYVNKAKKALAKWFEEYIQGQLADDGKPEFDDDPEDVFKDLLRIEFK